jgi:hypothetical protein
VQTLNIIIEGSRPVFTPVDKDLSVSGGNSTAPASCWMFTCTMMPVAVEES